MYTNHYTLNGTEIDHSFYLKPLLTASLFHDTFARMSYDLGISAIHLQAEQLSWVLSDMHFQFEAKLPFWREPYTIKTWIRRNQQVRVFVDFTATNGSGAIFARGTSIWLIIDKLSRQPNMAGHIFNKLITEPIEAIAGFRFPKLNETGVTIASDVMKVRVTDLDFNMHLNSVRYLGGGIECLGSEFLLSHKLQSVTVKYMKEVRCDETVNLSIKQTDEGYLHQIFNSHNEEASRFLTRWNPI